MLLLLLLLVLLELRDLHVRIELAHERHLWSAHRGHLLLSLHLLEPLLRQHWIIIECREHVWRSVEELLKLTLWHGVMHASASASEREVRWKVTRSDS